MAEPVPRARVVQQLLELGVEPGRVLLVHTSFRAMRPVEGGPQGLIEALGEALGPEGTLVMPSWSDQDDTPFDPATSEASESLGVVALTFWRLPGVLRSDHVHAFAARGPEAARILRDPLPLPPHNPRSPVGRVHDLDGQVLLLGVDHDADTTIHLAELVADVPYRILRHCTVLRRGQPRRIEYGENDHCCARFVFVGEWLTKLGLQAEGPVANGSAKLTRSKSIVRAVLPRLQRDPLLFLHPESEGCEECDEARRTLTGDSTVAPEAPQIAFGLLDHEP